MPNVADGGLADLLSYTKAFLENNALVIYGYSSRTSGAAKFRLALTDRKWKCVDGGEARDVPFWVMYGADQYNALAANRPSSAPVDVHYVSMREFANGAWEDVDTTHYMLPSSGGADIMVTSKLNGCTFGIGSSAGGGRLVSHLRPPTQLADAAAKVSAGTESGFAHHASGIDYRVMSTSNQNGTVVGVRSGTRWVFYVQRFDIGAAAAGTVTAVAKLG